MGNGSVGFLSKAEEGLAAVLRAIVIAVGLALAFLMVIQVILRYGLATPFLGIEESSVLLGLWLYFMGVAYVTRQGAHISGGITELVFENRRTVEIVRLCGTLLCLISCFVFMYHAGSYANFIVEIGRKSTYLGWPTILWVSSMLVGFVLMAFYFFLQAVRQWRTLRKASRQEG